MGTSDSSQSKKSSDKGSKKNDKGKSHFTNPFKFGKSSTPPPPSPSSEKRPSFKRNGSLGKGSVKAPTTPHRPMLATEARSLVRPCHCGKDGVFKPHSHNHDHHQRVSVTPERTIREHKGSSSPKVTRKTRGVTPPLTDHHPQQHKSPSIKTPSLQVKPLPLTVKTTSPPAKSLSPPVKAQSPTTTEPPPTVKAQSPTTTAPPPVLKAPPKTAPKPSGIPTPTKTPNKADGTNKFVSTVVWYPELEPEFNATKVKLSPDDDATRCIDRILVKEFDSYIKKKFPQSDDTQFKLEEPIYTKHVTTNNLIGDFESSLLQESRASIS